MIEPLKKITREQKSQQTKSLILASVKELLISNGINSLTTHNICLHANISNGVFFHFFKSKTQLVIEFLHLDYEEYQHTHPFDVGHKTFSENIISIYLHNIAYCKSIGIEFIKIYYSISNKALLTFSPKTENITPFTSAILNQIQIATESGELREVADHFTLLNDLSLIVKGCIFEWAISDGEYPIEKQISRIISIYLRNYLN